MITIFLNPAAGARHSDDMPSRLRQLFAAEGLPAEAVEVVSVRSSAETTSAARAAAEAGHDGVVAAGGDGTVSTVAAALVGLDTPLGVLPLGTLNHFARDAGIPLALEAAVKTIAMRRTVKVDVGEVNGRTFVNNSSIGIYPDVVKQREALREQGYRKWTAFAVAITNIIRNFRGVAVKITADRPTETARTPFLLVGNNEYQTDGIHLGDRARINGGQLSAYLAPRVHARELPRLFALALAGRAREGQLLESFVTRELRVETPESRSLRVALDGEIVVMTTPLHYRVRPQALRVIVP